jgi:hypothetical protein
MPKSCLARCRTPQNLWEFPMWRRFSAAHFGALTRFANNTIHQNVAEQDRWLSVRVALDHRTARATTNRFDPDSIRGAVEQALALARSAAPNPDLLPLNRALGDFRNQALRRGYGERHARASRTSRRGSHSHSRKPGTNRRRHLLHGPKRRSDLQFARRRGLARRNDGAVFDHRHGRR